MLDIIVGCLHPKQLDFYQVLIGLNHMQGKQGCHSQI